MVIHEDDGQISTLVYDNLSAWSLMVVLLTVIMSACSAIALCVGVTVYPGNDTAIQAILEANPTGTAFCFQPGTYRSKAPISPKDNQVLISQQKGAAILSGAQVVTGFQFSNGHWV